MAIFFDKETKTFYLEGKNITYAFFINNVGYHEHLYFGEKISRDFLLFNRAFGGHASEAHIPGEERESLNFYHSFASEITSHGLGDFREPTVQVENIEGDRLCELLYVGHKILDDKPKPCGLPAMRGGGKTLVVHLCDPYTYLAADLYYTGFRPSPLVHYG